MALDNRNIVLLVGGVGGAKLALGLQAVLPPENLTIIVNTGDDFWHYGLRICPDIDTLLYTLSGRVNKSFGWGVADDTKITLQALDELGEDIWFTLGDKDLATHLLRTHILHHGKSLTEAVSHLAEQMGVRPTILPMTNAEVPTLVETEEHGTLEFQEYFVRYRWQPIVKALVFNNIENAIMTDEVHTAMKNADAIIIGPSNPWLSIAPILAVPDMRQTIMERNVPRIAVTPIVKGTAIKGPAAKLMAELGYEVSAKTVAQYYGDAINAFVQDERDDNLIINGLQTVAFDTMMTDDTKKIDLARMILNWINTMEGV